MEEIRPVPVKGFETYFVSDQGKVYSKKGMKLMPGSDNGCGYKLVSLTSSEPDPETGRKRQKSFLIHRLVALAFLPNPLRLEQVDHKNGNKGDNRAANLQWMTREDNNRKSRKAYKPYKGKKAVRCVETGEVFDSQSKAAKWAKRSDVSMMKSIKNKTKCGGYTFERIEKKDKKKKEGE